MFKPSLSFNSIPNDLSSSIENASKNISNFKEDGIYVFKESHTLIFVIPHAIITFIFYFINIYTFILLLFFLVINIIIYLWKFGNTIKIDMNSLIIETKDNSQQFFFNNISRPALIFHYQKQNRFNQSEEIIDGILLKFTYDLRILNINLKKLGLMEYAFEIYAVILCSNTEYKERVEQLYEKIPSKVIFED